MELAHIVDGLVGLVLVGLGWFLSNLFKEQKRIEILLNRTREEVARDYATKDELRDDMRRVMDALHRVEDKLDKALTEK